MDSGNALDMPNDFGKQFKKSFNFCKVCEKNILSEEVYTDFYFCHHCQENYPNKPKRIIFTISLTKDLFVSESNRGNEHWSKKSKRHQTQKFLIKSYMNDYVKDFVKLPCIITMTRIAPRSLDADDNLKTSMKYFKDYIADFLIPGLARGRADSDPRIQWKYDQQKGEPKQYALKVEINY